MADDWIKMRCNLHEDVKVDEICDITGLDSFAVVGRLHKIWSWIGEQSVDGTDINTSDARIDSRIGFDGFSTALRQVGWMVGENRHITFVNFAEHNGATAKKRAQDSARMVQKRSSRKIVETNSTREEKRREEKSNTKSAASASAGFDWSADCPTSLNTPEVVGAFAEWQAYRAESKLGKWRPVTIRKCLTQFEQLGPKVFIAAIDKSIANGWRGVFPGDRGKGKPPGRANDANTVGEQDIMLKLRGATV